jgi:hypothetical protein
MNLQDQLGSSYPNQRGKRDNIHNNVVNNVNDGIKSRGVFMGPMSYGITWLLMLLKVLHNPPRPIGIFMPKSQGKKGIIINNVVNNVNDGKEMANNPHSESIKWYLKHNESNKCI